MRSVRVACVCVLVVALAAFRLQSATDAAPVGVASIPSDRDYASNPAPHTVQGRGQTELPADTPQVRPAPDTAQAETAAGQEDQQGLRADSDSEPRRRRWRRPNRYPGPIPTPAEWAPPEGPIRIALQAGHWRANEAPAELAGLRGNGTRAHGRAEWEINLDIARRAGAMLEAMGYQVDILPAVVPPSYRAHLFISIHADGSADPRASGYRVAAPRRDATGRASLVAALLARTYGEATGLKRIPTVTRRMRSYYAFNFRRYEHALHPMTIGVILETGFLTSATDRGVIVSDPDRAARGIVEAVAAFSETPPPAKAELTAGSGPG